MSIIFAILLFSILIFVHELGHFMDAKASGVQVNEFAIFMGPAIWKKQKGETLYSIRCIPIGGYCAMEGEDKETENPKSFQKATWWKRLCILLAGSVMNLIVGIILFAIVFGCAYKSFPINEVEGFDDCSLLLEDNLLQPGDKIVTLGGFTGRILTIKDDEVTFETGAAKTRLTIKKWAIQTREGAETAASVEAPAAEEESK